MAEIDIADVMNIMFKNLPTVDLQKAILDEIHIRIQNGESEKLAIHNVFSNNSSLNKPH